MIEIVLASLLVMLASLVGVVSLWSVAGRFVSRNLGFLVSFSAGVFLVIIYGLLQELLAHADSAAGALVWVGVGMVGVWLLFKLLPTLHHHDTHKGEHVHHPIDARKLLISDGVHNIGDGILLAASFLASPVLGIAAAASIFIHETVQEISEFFVLRDAGYAPRRALMLNFAVSSTVLVGAIGGYYALELFEALEVPLLGIAAGAFLVVVLTDLIPHSVRDAKTTEHHAKHVAWFLIGLVLMSLVAWTLPHPEEPHDEEHTIAKEQVAG
jgi:zinc and cadmium transporter